MNPLIDFLGIYKVGEIIYPSVLKRNLKQVDQDTLDLLVKSGYLSIVKYALCPQCSHFTRFCAEEEIEKRDEKVFCEECDEVISIKYFMPAYKVLKLIKGDIQDGKYGNCCD